jgi:hypothetical protein
MLGGLVIGGDELIDQGLGDPDQRGTIDAVLQPTQSRRRGQGPVVWGRLASSQLQHGVDAKGLMVIEVFVAQGDRRDPLRDQGALVVDDQGGVAGVGDGRVQSIEQPDPLGDLAEQQCAGIGGKPPPRKIGADCLK